MNEQCTVVRAKDTEIDASVGPLSGGEASSLNDEIEALIKALTVSHRKWIVGGACLLCLIMFICFIGMAFDFAIKETFSPFSLIPVRLMAICPTAILLCILRSLYPPKDKEKADLSGAIPVKLVIDVAKDIIK